MIIGRSRRGLQILIVVLQSLPRLVSAGGPLQRGGGERIGSEARQSSHSLRKCGRPAAWRKQALDSPDKARRPAAALAFTSRAATPIGSERRLRRRGRAN